MIATQVDQQRSHAFDWALADPMRGWDAPPSHNAICIAPPAYGRFREDWPARLLDCFWPVAGIDVIRLSGR
jgi:hypothetical protein